MCSHWLFYRIHDFRFMLYAELHFEPIVAQRLWFWSKSQHRSKCLQIPALRQVFSLLIASHVSQNSSASVICLFLIHLEISTFLQQDVKCAFGHWLCYKMGSAHESVIRHVLFLVVASNSCWQSHVCYNSSSAANRTFLDQDVKFALIL